MRKEVDLMKGEITSEDLVTQEMLVELRGINHLLTHPQSFVHFRIQGEVKKRPLLGIKGEDVS
jgi:hypothetical protein